MGGMGRTPAALRTASTAATTTSPATESSPAPAPRSAAYRSRKGRGARGLSEIRTDALERPAIVGDELEGEIPGGLGEEEDVESVEHQHDDQLN